MNARNIGRFFGSILFSVAISASASLRAEVVANVLVTTGSSVKLYSVGDSDEWTLIREICSLNYTFSAVEHEGVIYVSTSTYQYDGSSGTVKMYSIRGEHLGDLPPCEFLCCKLAVSPDGRYLFAGNGSGSGSNTGCIYRYDFSSGTWTKFLRGINACIRGLTFDNSGHMFVGNRAQSSYGYKWDTADSDLPLVGVASASVSVTGSGMDFVCPLYMHTDGYIYWAGRGGLFGRFKPDGSEKVAWNGDYKGWSFNGIMVLNGKVHVGTFNATGGYALWRQTEPGATTFEMALGTGSSVSYYDISEVKAYPTTTLPFTGSTGSSVLSGTAGCTVWPQGGACGGAVGVSGTSLCFTGGCSRAEIANSKLLVPATSDFAAMFWVGMPAAGSATGGRVLFSNDVGQNGALSLMADPDGGHLNKLGLKFTPDVSSTPVTLATDAVIADGNWHHVAVVRREGTSLELWLDGVRTGIVAVAASDAVARDWNWRLGSSGNGSDGFIGAGAFIDEFSLYDTSIPLPGQMAGIAAAYSPGAIPSVPSPSAAEPSAMPAAYGTEIARSPGASGAPLANPNLLKASDGSWWIAAGTADGQAADAVTRFWRSNDDGATWTADAAVALEASGVSLFESGNSLCAIGMNAADCLHTCSVWVLSDGEWSEQAAYTNDSPMFAGAGAVAVVNGRVCKAVSLLARPYSSGHRLGCMSFSVDGVAFGSPNLTVNTEAQIMGQYDTIVEAIPGIAVEIPSAKSTVSDNMAILSPIVDGDRTDILSVRGIEREFGILMQSSASGMNRRDVRNCMFRGGAKSFDVKYDEASGLYWALTVAVTNTAEYASRRADTVRNALALYASPDLETWMPCGVVAVSGDVDATGFNGPAFTIDGDDLVVAVGVSCDNGAGGPRTTAHNAYIAFRRIANFRTAYEPVKPGRMRMLTCNYARGCVDSAWYDDASGEWYAAGVFCNVTVPQNIVAFRDRVYVSIQGGNPTRVNEYSNTGRLRRTLTAPAEFGMSGSTVALALSPDGNVLYVSAPDSQADKIYKVDLASGEWSLLVQNSKIYKPNRLATGPDGSLYAGNYMALVGTSTCLVNRFDAEGNWISSPYSGYSQGGPISGMALDGGYLYMSWVHGKINRIDLETSEYVMMCDRRIEAVSTAFATTIFNGRLYVTSTWGWVDSFDLETFERHSPVASRPSSNSSLGIAIVDVEWRRGSSIHIR